ncbi:MAG: hypothetical protein JST54_06100 [Deltaproteobacteria bacterium]|nr:hypothetical protein [Deltaproteobacteria bacterium]
MESQDELRGREALGFDGVRVGTLVELRADRLILDVPDLGRLEVPHGDLLRTEGDAVVLRRGAAWYRQLAVEPGAAPAGIQDGRLHDVTVDGEPPIAELQPGAELGDDPERPNDATAPGLRASSIGPNKLPPGPPVEPPDVEAEGSADDDSDRIVKGARGTHRGGVTRKRR